MLYLSSGKNSQKRIKFVGGKKCAFRVTLKKQSGTLESSTKFISIIHINDHISLSIITINKLQLTQSGTGPFKHRETKTQTQQKLGYQLCKSEQNWHF